MCVHSHVHTQQWGVMLQHTGLSSLTDLNLGTYIWNARISLEPCGKRVCGQWQLGWFAITGLSAWLNTAATSLLTYHCGLQPTNSWVLKDNFSRHFSILADYFQTISSASYLLLLHPTMLLQFIPISLLIWSQPWKKEVICERSSLPCHQVAIIPNRAKK